MTPAAWIAAAAVLLAVAVLLVPRRLLANAQDRLAAKIIERERGAFRLLTRAELVVGRYRRIPGVLGLVEGAVRFDGLFGESIVIPTSRIRAIATGNRLASDRRLVRLEVLRITRTSGEVTEFVMKRASVFAWRSHLGLWAMAERQADADRVTPGRKPEGGRREAEGGTRETGLGARDSGLD